MKKWYMKFLERKIYENLKEAAEVSESWKIFATKRYAKKLTGQICN